MLKSFLGKIGHFFKFIGLTMLSFFGIYLTNKEGEKKATDIKEEIKDEPKKSKELVYTNELPLPDDNQTHSLFPKSKTQPFVPQIYDLTENETGIGIKIYSDEDGKIVVYKVSSGSPAEKAGIREGDILTKFNGQKLNNMKASELVTEAKKAKDETKEITLIDKENTKKTFVIEEKKTIEEPVTEAKKEETVPLKIETEDVNEIIKNFDMHVLPVRPLIIKRPINRLKTDRNPAIEAAVLLGTTATVITLVKIPMMPYDSQKEVIVKRKNIDTPIIMPIVQNKDKVDKKIKEEVPKSLEKPEEKPLEKVIEKEKEEEKPKTIEEEKEEEAIMLAKMAEEDILEKEKIIKTTPDKKEAILKILSQDYNRKATLLPIILFRYNIVSNLFSMSMLNNSLVSVRNLLGSNIPYHHISHFIILSKHKTLDETENLTLDNLILIKEIRSELVCTYGNEINNDINLIKTMDKIDRIENDLEKRYEKTMQKKHARIKKLIKPSQF